MALYADLRKTQAELDEQRRDQLVQGHTPRNYARMKTHDEPAAGAKPEDFLPSSPIRNMTTEQVIGFEKARGNWDDAKAETYRQAQAARTPNMQLIENQQHTTRARDFVRDQKAEAMPPEEVVKRYEQVQKLDEARAFEKQQMIHTVNGDEEARDAHRRQGAQDVLKIEENAERKKALEAERHDSLAGKGYDDLYTPDPNGGPSRNRGGRGR